MRTFIALIACALIAGCAGSEVVADALRGCKLTVSVTAGNVACSLEVEGDD